MTLPQGPLRGIALKLLAVAIFVAMSAVIKSVADRIPPGETVFFRSAFAIPVIVVWLMMQQGTHGGFWEGLRTANPMGHVWRGVLGTASMGFTFAGLGMLPLPEATAIGYAAPMLTVIFAAIFLGEKVRGFRIFAVTLGMVGVVIVMSPHLTTFRDLPPEAVGAVAPVATLGAIVVLTGAVFTALAQVTVRRLVAEEKTTAIVFRFSVTAAVLSLVTLPFGWSIPDMSTFATLVVAGLLGGLAQVFLTSAYRHADASVVAPFDYASMVLAVAVGYLVFDEVPTRMVILGSLLIMVAGGLIIWRERALGRDRADPPESVTDGA